MPLPFAIASTDFSISGIADVVGPIADAKREDITEHINVNTIGPLVLFQAIHSILAKGALFAVIGSLAGSISFQSKDFQSGVYSISKVAVNMVVKRIAVEHPDVVALTIQ